MLELGLDAEALTVAQLLDRYELIKGPRWSPSTTSTYGYHVRPLREAFGPGEISQLRAADIEAVYAGWIGDGISPATVRRRHGILAAAFRQAERWGMILASPCRSVELAPADRLDHAGLPDAAAALEAIGRLTHERLKVMARLAVATGARRGELVALRWSDVDLDAGTVRVAGAIAVGDELVRKSTKSGERRTAMAIDAGTVAVLRAWRSKVAAEAMQLGLGRPADDAPLVPSPTDPREPWHPDRITTTWVRHRDRIGMAKVRWHDLRHLHASALLAGGVPSTTVAARLGHSSTKTTLDVYAHAVPAGDAAAADVISRAAGDS